ncbi:MAG: hypothetical protein Q4E62_03975 [Sutterellaceae bacterium]|nr:hypothetical protein [Sutterellaceae bacterium]
MGCFSWITSDTKRSISASGSSRGALPVYLITPTDEAIFEPEYEGYGIFGGHDAMALLARWNAPDKCNGDDSHDRIVGIHLQATQIKYPLKFAEAVAPYASLEASEPCLNQGFFY